MRLLMVSDLHCEKNPDVFEWLQELLNETRPDYLIVAGDWGECSSYPQLLPKDQVITVYGNHDNVFELRNKFTLLDGDVVDLGGLRVGGISGIISPKGTPTKTGIPRKRPSEYVMVANRIKGKTDLMVIHEAPYIPEVFGRMWKSAGSLAALKAVNVVKPKILFVGHLHLAPALHAELEDGLHIVHVDSTQKGYALLDLKKGSLSGYKDNIKVFEVSLNLMESTLS